MLWHDQPPPPLSLTCPAKPLSQAMSEWSSEQLHGVFVISHTGRQAATPHPPTQPPVSLGRRRRWCTT
jgi:hypothetical protein